MTKNLPILYEGHELSILVDDDKLVNLTDIWKMQGSPEYQEPWKWQQTDQATAFIESLQADPNHRGKKVWKSKRGRHGGTYAHWQIALAYSAYLSPKLHQVINQVFKERLEETLDPELAYERGRQRATSIWLGRGKDIKWIAKRIQGIPIRNEYTSSLQGRGVTQPKDFAACTNALYVGLYGAPACDMRKERGLGKNENLRDHMTDVELSAASLGESLSVKMMTEKYSYGTEECKKDTHTAAVNIQKAIAASMKGIILK